MLSLQYFIFLLKKLFETSGLKLIKLRTKIKYELLKKCLKRVMKSYASPLLPSVAFFIPLLPQNII